MPKEDDTYTYLVLFWLGYACIKGLQSISIVLNVTESHPLCIQAACYFESVLAFTRLAPFSRSANSYPQLG